MTLSPLPAARLPNNHATPVGRQLYTERIKRMTQRPTQRTADWKAAYTASLPMHGGTVIDNAHN